MSQNLERGNKLWEGSRMFLPEHKQAILERKKTQKKAGRPLLDEQQLEEMNQLIIFSKKKHLPVHITYLQDGFFKDATGYADQFYDTSQVLRMIDMSMNSLTLKVIDICAVQLL